MNTQSATKWMGYFFLFALLAGALYFIFVPWSNEPGLRVPAQLIVNGQPIADENIIIYQRGSDYYADLPFTAVVDALGYPVTWDETNSAHIEVGGTIYLLSGDRLCNEEGKLITRISRSDVNDQGSEGRLGELYLEQNRLQNVLELLGIQNTFITIDPAARTVSVITGAPNTEAVNTQSTKNEQGTQGTVNAKKKG